MSVFGGRGRTKDDDGLTKCSSGFIFFGSLKVWGSVLVVFVFRFAECVKRHQMALKMLKYTKTS